MKRLILLLALATLPLSARADLLFKCTPVENGSVSAQIRFSERGKDGYVEVDDWADYPPAGLAYGNLHETLTQAAGRLFLSEEDRHTGISASLLLPKDFLASKDFAAQLVLHRKNTAPSLTRLHCVSF